ncbi:hypothetical protein VTN96DRAFT_8795 [Rasamsonia emersonii]
MMDITSPTLCGGNAWLIDQADMRHAEVDLSPSRLVFKKTHCQLECSAGFLPYLHDEIERIDYQSSALRRGLDRPT